MERAPKSEHVSFRVSAEIKALMEARAPDDNRSLTNYIIALARANATKRGIKQVGMPKD